MNDENFGLKKTLSIKIEELNPSFLNNDIMSFHGDHRRVAFKIAYKEECYFVECQIKPVGNGYFNCYIITKEYNTQHISSVREYRGVFSEEFAIETICEYLNERFSS